MRPAPLLASLLVLAALAPEAQADEIAYRLTGPDGASIRLVVRDLGTGRVEVERVTATSTLRGAGQRVDDRLVATLAPANGLAGTLQGAQAAPRGASWRIGGGSIVGRLEGELADERGAAEPLPASTYAHASSAALDAGRPIDVDAENAAVSARLRTLSPAERSVKWPVIICPGYASDDQSGPIHARSIERLKLAAEVLREVGAHAILVSGGNVHPKDTPWNEALEMKRALLALGVPADRIAIDPAARHTTTNLRNAGRFVLAHGLSRALVVTTQGQSFYVGRPLVSTFHLRCLSELGYRVGRLRAVGLRRTDFVPVARCFEVGRDPLDR